MRSTPRQHIVVRRWLFMIAGLMGLGIALGWDLYTDYTSISLIESERLIAQAEVVDKNLENQLTATNHALDSIRSDLPAMLAGKDGLANLNRSLATLRGAMPTTRAVTVFDADGTLVARNPDQFVGENFRTREYFQAALQGGKGDRLYVAAPFLAKTGEYVLNMSKAIFDSHGNFAGVILVSLGPEYFEILLSSVLYAPDMLSTLVHGDGKIIFRAPDSQGLAGTVVDAVSGPFFFRHMQSARKTSILSGSDGVEGAERLSALRTISPATVPMDKPLVISISRDIPALFTPWRESGVERGGMFALLALATIAGFVLYRKRQLINADLLAEQEARRRQAEEALHLQTLELGAEVAERKMAQENLQEQTIRLEREIEERRQAQEELEVMNDELDRRVKARTRELEEKGSELYQMNRLFVGRELRMVELKERIKELEDKEGNRLNNSDTGFSPDIGQHGTCTYTRKSEQNDNRSEYKEQQEESMGKQNCWEKHKCERQPGGAKVGELGVCPASTDSALNGLNGGSMSGRICWRSAGTMCGGKIQGTWAEKLKNCSTCEFYKSVRQEEGTNFTA